MKTFLFMCVLCFVLGVAIHTPARAQDPVAGAAAGLAQEATPPVSAASPVAIFVPIWNAIDGPLQGVATQMSGTVAGTARTWLPPALTIWLILWAAGQCFSAGGAGSVLFGALTKELAWGAAALATITIYTGTIVPFLQNGLPGELAGIFTGTGTPADGGGVAAAYDQAWSNVRALGHLVAERIPDSLRPSIIAQMILIPIIQAAGGLFLGWAFFVALSMQIIKTVLVVAGAIFVGLAAIPSTRRYAWGWLSALLGTIATVAFTSIILGLALGIIKAETQVLGALPEATDIYDQIDGFMAVVGVLFLLACAITSMPIVAAMVFHSGAVTGGIRTGASAVAGAAATTTRAVGRVFA